MLLVPVQGSDCSAWCRSCSHVLANVEGGHPAQFGEFGDVGMEHVEPGFMLIERELEDAALGLHLR